MPNKFYVHPKCSTCKKALSFLKSHSVDYEEINILLTPPSKRELLIALEQGKDAKKILNTSGNSYRSIEDREKFLALAPDILVDKLSHDPMLIKRPFFILSNEVLVGFNEKKWNQYFNGRE